MSIRSDISPWLANIYIKEKYKNKECAKFMLNTVKIINGDDFMKLKIIDIKIFKKEVYKYYKKLFPNVERKSFRRLKKCYKLNTCHFIGIYNDNNLIGFMIVNIVNGISFIQLDYFAIFPEYQNKGFGTKSLKLLKDFFQQYDGLFGEIEAVGYGNTSEENENRARRKKFYEKMGFIFLHYEFDLFDVIYTPCVFYFKNENIEDTEIVKDMFEFYNVSVGKNAVKNNCSYKSTK